MTSARLGLLLRLIGPAIEIVCIGLLLSQYGQGRSVFGQDIEPFLYLGIAIGLAMVAVGLGLSSRRSGKRSRSELRRESFDPE